MHVCRVRHTGLLLLLKCPAAAEQINNLIPWNQQQHGLPHVVMTSYRVLLAFLVARHEPRVPSGVGVCVVIGDLICVLVTGMLFIICSILVTYGKG